MPPVHFSVSQVRVAASCPRILYFDARHTNERNLRQPRVTQIWKNGGSEATACGGIFHNCIESFNRAAGTDADFHRALTDSRDRDELGQAILRQVWDRHLNKSLLFEKSGPQQQAFLTALRIYVDELADVVQHARGTGRPIAELAGELFGDRRRRVDVTFAVGAESEEVHVSGVLDYLFFDWRTGRNRIIDYKLAPSDTPGSDLFQVCVYALMHHQQHGSEPDVGILYLHPTRRMYEKSWQQIAAERDTILGLLASMAAWVRYDSASGAGLKPPGEPVYCETCVWSARCESELGPKHEGQRLTHVDVPSSGDRLVHPSEPGEITATETPKIEASRLEPSEGIERRGTPEENAALVVGERSGRPVEISAASLSTHVAVVGAAGSGKTWMSKVIAEEAARRGIAVLAIDPQGDLVQMIRSNADDASADAWRRRVEPRILTPGTSHGRRISLSPVRLSKASDFASVESEQRRREEIESLFSSVSANLVHLARAGGDVDCQRAFLFRILRQLADVAPSGAVGLEQVVAAVGDPEAVGVEDPDRMIKKSEREKIARKLHAILHGPAASLFTGGEPLVIDRLVEPVEGRTPINIVYLNALADDDQKQFFVSSLATEIYRWMIATGSAGGTPKLVFYLDEARDFLPAGSRKPPAKEPLLRLFAQGRKFGVACLICTQSPRSVDYNAFTNCSTKLIGRLESAQDVARVAEWFATEGAAPSWLGSRKGAEPGSFVGRWPGMAKSEEGVVWKSRRLYTMHSGAWSPERVEHEWRTIVEDRSPRR